MFWLVALCLVPSFILPLQTVVGGQLLSLDYILLFPVLINGLLLVFLWRQFSGYMIFGITDESFRNALHSALNALELSFQETISRIHLTSLNTDLQVAVQGWMGIAQVRMREQAHRRRLQDIAAKIHDYFSTNRTPMNLTTSTFYLIVGVLTATFAIVFGVQTAGLR